jgi:hypothetical protein
MSLITYLLVIGGLIVMAIIIQFLVRSKGGGSDPTDMFSVAMITSDWYLDPLYSKGSGAKNVWSPSSRGGDAPIGLVKSALEDFSKDVLKEQRLFFFTGDIFSHDLGVDIPNVSIEKTIMYKVFDNNEGLLKYFNPENIFFVVGNHGEKTNEGFRQKDIVSESWTQSLVDNGVYVPTGPGDIFWECGYYKKHLPNSAIDIICFNSIMYSVVDGHNGCQDKQIARLKADLDNLPAGRTVYIITHYPDDTDGKSFLWDKIGIKYQKVVSGIFTGYTHTPLTSLNQWKSEKGIAHTWNVPSIYWRDMDVSSYVKVNFQLNDPLVLSQEDVRETSCKNVKISEIVWSS